MTDAAGPLAGIRVVELAGIGPSPHACLLLAELGADVLRLARPGVAAIDGLDRSRPRLDVDLTTPTGRDLVLRLAARADVLVEGMRPGVAERLGIGPEQCRAGNPRLVYARMTGWGQHGPLADRAGHDITYAALTGALHVTGPAEQPMPAVNLVADYGGGSLYLLVGILAALLERDRSGQGQVVDAAMVDGVSSLMSVVYAAFAAGVWQDERRANLIDGAAPFYDTYRCADGKFVAVGALEAKFYAQLLEGLGLAGTDFGAGTDAGAHLDRATWPAQRAAFTRVFASRTRDAWAAHFAGTDACVAAVLSLAEAPGHPHLVARGTFSTMDGTVVPTVAPRFSRTPGLAPTPGRHADPDLLAAWGIDADPTEASGR
jgi:alpha-methylacyl-CoA racemase